VGQFFIRRPIVAIVIALIMLIAGGVSVRGLPSEQYPDIVPPQVLVTSTFPGAEAVTVEQSVSTPLEQQINGVDNMLYVQSTNANDGTSQVRVTFDVGTDPDTNNVLVQNRVTQATPFLPPEVRNQGITVRKATSLPTVALALISPNASYDSAFLANYATINITDRLLRIPGIGQINVFGATDYAMRVWVNPDQLTRLGLTVAEVAGAIRRQSTVNPVGQIGGEPAPAGQEFTYAARAQGRLVTAEEFQNIVVRAKPDGSLVRLGEVARIDLGTQAYSQRARKDGKPAAIVAVYQLPDSNALQVVTAVRREMELLKQRFPPDLHYEVAVDFTLPVSEGIREIVVTLLEAVALVIVVVFLFLQSWRATLVPLLTIPVSLIGTFAVFPLFGFTINTLSLFGLVLAIGLVVDDAIVVVEAVERQIEAGKTAPEATAIAMRQVSGPVVAIALILSAVFIPVALVGGISGRLYQQFAITIAVAVLLSAINALTLSPALCAMLLKPRRAPRGPVGRFFAWFNRGFDRTTHGYISLVGLLIRRLGLALVALVIVSGLASLGASRLPSSFVPEEDQGILFAQVVLPDASSLQRTDAACRKLEAILARTEGVKGFAAVPGFSLLTGISSSSAGFVFIALKPWHERKAPALRAEAIAGRLNMAMAGQLGEAQGFVFGPPAIPGIGSSAGFSFMLQDTAGGTPQALEQQTARFVAAANQRPELRRVNSLFRASVPQVFVAIDRDRALKLGVDLADLYGTLQAFMGSVYVNDFNRFGRQWRVYLAAEPTYRARAANIENFYVKAQTGALVPLGSLVKVTDTTGPEYTTRFNLLRAAEVLGQAAPGRSSGDAMDALEQVAAQVLPREYTFSWNALSYQQRISPGIAPVLALSLVVVFLVLAALYESWSLPFSVLLSVPVAVAGAVVGLMLRRLDFDVYAQIGLLMLVGLSAKNAILIVEFARAEQQAGKSPVEAAVAAARLRLRPIIMTSMAFILACVPLLSAAGSGAVARRVLGTVVVAGMVAATLIGVLFIPVLYVAVEKAITWSASRRKRRERPPHDSQQPQPLAPEGHPART
jgi:HAE1 family hydrophobic/amphiphilic exporter-1